MQVRLITENGSKLVEKEDALKLAENEGLDLIYLNKNGDIPVVKIGDLSKHLYEQKKKEKELKKKNKASQIETKEIRITDVCGLNDLKTKAKMIDKFLQDNNKVKLSVRYRGRAINHINEGPKKLEQLTDLISKDFKIEQTPLIQGNTVIMTIVPSH